MSPRSVTTRILDGFRDSALGGAEWNALLPRGDSNVFFLTWEWQRAWWDSYERSGLMLLLAEEDGEAKAIAPFFAEEGMIYFVGSGGSDYLDFIGDISAPGVLEALLNAARERVDNFAGFRFYHVLDDSRTAALLREAAGRLGLIFREEGQQVAPYAELGVNSTSLTDKKSLVRHERRLSRDGTIEVEHFSAADAIEPLLFEFFDQHIRRWSGTPFPSLFLQPQHQRFYRAVTAASSPSQALRFARVRWNGRAIAFHFGFMHRASFMWYKPTFEIELARFSPGEVLLRQLLLRAIEEGAERFDFGLGDEPFKQRFATGVRSVRDLGLYPAGRPLPEL